MSWPSPGSIVLDKHGQITARGSSFPTVDSHERSTTTDPHACFGSSQTGVLPFRISPDRAIGRHSSSKRRYATRGRVYATLHADALHEQVPQACSLVTDTARRPLVCEDLLARLGQTRPSGRRRSTTAEMSPCAPLTGTPFRLTDLLQMCLRLRKCLPYFPRLFKTACRPAPTPLSPWLHVKHDHGLHEWRTAVGWSRHMGQPRTCPSGWKTHQDCDPTQRCLVK